MITFQQDFTRFTYRVAGIVLHNEAALFELSNDKTFYNLPGGRAELRESASDGLIREMHEELEITANVVKLLYIVENFFAYDATFHHEIGLYFLMTFPSDAYVYTHPGPFLRSDNGHELSFSWLPLAKLEHLPIYPSFLRSGLQSLPEHPIHIVQE